MTNISPVLRWVGGKKKLLKQLKDSLPTSFDTYHEPFLGGGALAFDMQHVPAYLSDKNDELINFYQVLAACPQKLLQEFETMKNGEAEFYEIRNRDRTADFKNSCVIRRAARFLYLNKNCFNGIWRVNAKHGYNNVPYGRVKNPNVDVDNFFAASEYLKKVSITNDNFAETLSRAKNGDFVYFDPPYIPISKTESFVGYTADGFDWEQQVSLRDAMFQLRNNGVRAMISNSYCKLSLDLYNDLNIKVVDVSRTIGAQSHSRKNVQEIIVTNF